MVYSCGIRKFSMCACHRQLELLLCSGYSFFSKYANRIVKSTKSGGNIRDKSKANSGVGRMADCSVISWDNPGARRLTCRALVFSGEYEPDGEVPELPGCHFFYSMKIGCYSFPGVCHSQAPKSVF